MLHYTITNSFTKDGRYIVSRDYLTLKIWDINMENKPIQVGKKGPLTLLLFVQIILPFARRFLNFVSISRL